MKFIKYSGNFFSKGKLYEAQTTIPKPKNNQVLIKVKASSLNIIDFERFKKNKKLTSFAKVISLSQGKNVTLGGEVSGIVIDIGDQVSNFKKGDNVYGPTIGLMQYGGWAEFALCESKTLSIKPSTLSYEQAAVISLSGLTALGAIEAINIKKMKKF